MSDGTLLPNRAGQQAREENRCKRLRRAAIDLSRAWEAFTNQDDGRLESVENAIDQLRKALDS